MLRACTHLVLWATVSLGAVAGATDALAAAAAERGPARATVRPTAEPPLRLVVRFKAGTPRERALAADPRVREPALRMAARLSQRHGVALADGPSVDPSTQVVIAHGVDARALLRRLAADPEVESVEVDQRQRAFDVPDDPLYPGGQTATTPVVGQWYLRPPTTTEVAAIDAQGAWSLTHGTPDIVVALIDTGVRFEHPDLRRAAEGGKLLAGYDFVSADSSGVYLTANDGDGRDPDPSDPGDWISATEDRSGFFEDCGESPSSWHGTQTAGIVGALTNNALGIAGTGWDLKVLPLRGLGKCGGYLSDIAAAIRWAAGLSVPGVPDNPTPARVINLSLGSPNTCSSTYQSAIDAVRALGVAVVAAAGNEGVAVNQPANCKGVVAVAGVRHTGTKVGYSNLGPQVALAAPAGNCVNLSGACLYPLTTTSNDGATTPANSIYTGSGDDATIGTSFASPLVAATAGLMLSVHPRLSPDGLTTQLRASVRAFPPRTDPTIPLCRVPSGFDDVPQVTECYCTTDTCGAGLLDAAGAVRAALLPQVTITVTPASPSPGESVTLDASASTAARDRELVRYAWTVVAGSAEFSGATDAATVTLVPSAVGTLSVQLTVTDSAGGVTSAVTDIAVESPDSGGGATGPGWILALALATWCLRRVSRRTREG